MIVRLVLAGAVAIALLIGSVVGGAAVVATSSAPVLLGTVQRAGDVSAAYSGRVACGASGEDALLAANAARAAGWPQAELLTAVMVAGAESGFDPTAGNRLADGRTHRGLWQISSLHLTDPQINVEGGDQRFDPVVNARMALRLWERAGGWRPWEAYTNGRYRAFEVKAREAVEGTRAAAACQVPAGPLDGRGDQPRTAALRAELIAAFPELRCAGCIGGLRAQSRGRGHMAGHALDAMTYDDVELGWRVVAFVQQRWGGQVEYVIFQQRIWHPGAASWRLMEDRGSATENHLDHPHIELLPG